MQDFFGGITRVAQWQWEKEVASPGKTGPAGPQAEGHIPSEFDDANVHMDGGAFDLNMQDMMVSTRRRNLHTTTSMSSLRARLTYGRIIGLTRT